MSERTSARAPVRRQASELVRAAVVNGVSLRHALRGANAIARRRFEPSLRRSPVLGSLPALSPRLRRLEVGWIRRFGPIARPPAPAPVPRGTWIDLTDAHWRAAVAGPGWSWPELDGGGIWADGSEARLVLDVDIPRGEDVLLEFELGRHADVSPNPFVTVFVNARPVTGWELEAHSERGPRRVEIPAWLADWCRPIEVTFRPREAFDPGCRSGVNDDRWFVPVTRVRVSAARDARADAADGTQLAV